MFRQDPRIQPSAHEQEPGVLHSAPEQDLGILPNEPEQDSGFPENIEEILGTLSQLVLRVNLQPTLSVVDM